MIAKLKEILAAYRHYRNYKPFLFYPEEIPDWNDEDRKLMAQFFESHLGKKLLVHMRYNNATMQAEACIGTGNTDIAKGYHIALQHIIARSMYVPKEATELYPPLSEEQIEDRLAP